MSTASTTMTKAELARAIMAYDPSLTESQWMRRTKAELEQHLEALREDAEHLVPEDVLDDLTDEDLTEEARDDEDLAIDSDLDILVEAEDVPIEDEPGHVFATELDDQYASVNDILDMERALIPEATFTFFPELDAYHGLLYDDLNEIAEEFREKTLLSHQSTQARDRKKGKKKRATKEHFRKAEKRRRQMAKASKRVNRRK